MKIRTKLLLLLTIGVLVPVFLSHFFAGRSTRNSMEGLIEDQLSGDAADLSGRINDRIHWMVDGLGLVVESVPFEDFPGEDLYNALSIPYRQLSDATMVALLNEQGKAVVRPYTPTEEEARLLARKPVTEGDIKRFANSVPLKLALTANVAIGPVHASDSGEPRMVVAVAFPLAGEEHRWVLAVEFSLDMICDLVVDDQADHLKQSRMTLMDTRGFSLCEPIEGSADDWKPMPDGVSGPILQAVPGSVHSSTEEEGAELRSVDEVDLTGWRVVVAKPEFAAMEPVISSMKVTVVWIGVAILIAILGGVVLAREISKPLRKLEEASQRIAGGDYEGSLEITSRDEVGNLALSFNKMTDEIRSWNVELTERVDERTRELKQAQEQIVRSQKLAAVGELGAGVAHEINNPLTGVVGLAQLLRSEAEPGSETAEMLDEIVANGKRVADVVNDLLRYSQAQVAADMQTVDIKSVFEKSVWMFEGRFEESGIDVVWEVVEDCQVRGVQADLRLVLNNLLDNALKSMPEGGKIRLSVGRVEGGAVKVAITDEGIGMTEEVRGRAVDPFFTTSRPGSGSKGLGLSSVHRVVGEHDGRFVLESELGVGTTVTIYLPGYFKPSKA